MGIFGNFFTKPFQSVSVARAREMLNDGAILIDVRTSQEWNAGHAPTARHFPLDGIERNAGTLSNDMMLVLVCKSGMRSTHAARMLAAQGHTVATVKGGMFAWQRSGGEVVAENGEEGRVS